MKKNDDFDIDFIIPWVDGSDSEWRKKFNFYAPKTIEQLDIRDERYRDYGSLKYWFRSVEKFAPWVRKIYFITDGQKPDWLDISNPKLVWIKHQDYIPKEFLPVFSSHPIEIFLNRLPGLSDRFVYFNDDLFLIKKVSKRYFFNKKGIPVDYASTNCMGIGIVDIPHIDVNNLELINYFFDKKVVLKKNFFKWFSLKTPKCFIQNLILSPWKTFNGITVRHFAIPYLKSTFYDVWNNCKVELERTAKNKFRNLKEDINQWLFRYWQLCSGNFVPKRRYTTEKLYQLESLNDKVLKSIMSSRIMEICINDDAKNNIDCTKNIQVLCNYFDKLLPEKSTFEK